MNWNKAIEMALRTWYPKDRDLHFNPHHPLGKLCGEWGELLDDYMKSLYKPDYELKPIKELGDVWYYDRILSDQFTAQIDQVDRIAFPGLDIEIVFETDDTELIISAMIYYANVQFLQLLTKGYVSVNSLFVSAQYSAIKEIGSRYGLSVQQITDSNWEKLKPGSKRGDEWAKTNYVNIGKIT